MAEAQAMKERALVVGEPHYMTARALYGLRDGGIEVAALFVHAAARWDFDRYLERRNPPFSAGAFLKATGLQAQQLRSRADWQLVLACIEAQGITLLLNVHQAWRVPVSVLQRLPGRALNLHPALLPVCRGPHPLAALLVREQADRFGGATLHLMTAGFDEGPIVAQQAVPLGPARDVLAWELALARSYAALASGPLPDYVAGRRQATPQREAEATIANGPDVAGRLHLSADLTAEEALRRARLFGQLHTLLVEAEGEVWRAMLPAERVGPRSGGPPRRGLWRLSFDVADARLSLRRRWPGDGRRQWRRRWRLVARAQP